MPFACWGRERAEAPGGDGGPRAVPAGERDDEGLEAWEPAEDRAREACRLARTSAQAGVAAEQPACIGSWL